MISISLKAILESLPRVTLQQRDELPKISAIYYVVVNELVLYLGKAKSLKNRWIGLHHHRTLQLETFTYANIPVYIYWRECKESLLCDEEKKEIDFFKPPLNESPVLISGTIHPDDIGGLVPLDTIWKVKGRVVKKKRPVDWLFSNYDLLAKFLYDTNPELLREYRFFCNFYHKYGYVEKQRISTWQNRVFVEAYKFPLLKFIHISKDSRHTKLYVIPEIAKAYETYLCAR
jgi:hypothetical protein